MVEKYRLHPGLTVVADDSQSEFVLEQLQRTVKLPVDDIAIVEILDNFSEWKDQQEVISLLTEGEGLSEQSARSLLTEFREKSILISEEDEYARIASRWEEAGWEEAFRYYSYIRDYPFIDYSNDEEVSRFDGDKMKEYNENCPPPKNYKIYDRHQTIELPEPGELNETLYRGSLPYQEAERESPPTVQDVSDILWNVFGETGTTEYLHQGDFLLKTSPSGGARHPTEAYIIAVDIDDLEPGIYHYSVKEHGLDVIPTSESVPELCENTTDANMDCYFSVVLTSMVERSMWRYREPRTYSVVQHDIGHLLETLRLSCNSYNLNVRNDSTFVETELETVLDIHTHEEPIFRHTIIE